MGAPPSSAAACTAPSSRTPRCSVDCTSTRWTTNGIGIKRGPTTRPESVLVIEVTISDYIKPPINMTLNVVVDLILHWRLGLFHEALARPIAKMCTQGVAGPYTHVSLDEVVYWSGALVVDSPPTFTVYMASEKLVYHRVKVSRPTSLTTSSSTRASSWAVA